MSANNALEDKNERKGDLSYHYWAGEKRDAPKAEPKKISEQEAQNMHRTNSASAQGGSAWNAAGTWEERSHNEWAKDQITARLVGIAAPGLAEGQGLSVVSVQTITGDANTVMVRGKKKHGFDFRIVLDWTAEMEDETIKGTLSIDEASRETVDDNELECEVKVETKKAKAELQAQATKAAKALLPLIHDQLVQFGKDFKSMVEST